jgi:hypothetical protein
LSTTSHYCQVWQELTTLFHFRNCFPFLEESTCWANMNAFAATGANFRGAPRLVEVSDNPRVDPSPHDIPNMGALNFVTNSNASRAKHTPVVVNNETLM